MIILSIRSDKPEAELGLYQGTQKIDYVVWQAHRELSTTIHLKMKKLLDKHHISFQDIEGIVVFRGPGSFTGLRIGITVANTFAAALGIPIVGCDSPSWLQKGLARLVHGENESRVLPLYGGPVHTTKPKH